MEDKKGSANAGSAARDRVLRISVHNPNRPITLESGAPGFDLADSLFFTGTWADFKAKILKRPRAPLPNKEQAGWFSPTEYQHQKNQDKPMRRATKHALRIHLAVLDVDDRMPPWDVMERRIAALGFEAVIYPSYSATEDHRKARIIFPLATPIERNERNDAEFKRSQNAVLESLASLLGVVPDTKCMTDTARLYYRPAHAEGRQFFMREFEGEFLDPVVLEELGGLSRIDAVATFTNLGLMQEPNASGNFELPECPFADAHSDPVKARGGAFISGQRAGAIVCDHNTCSSEKDSDGDEKWSGYRLQGFVRKLILDGRMRVSDVVRQPERPRVPYTPGLWHDLALQESKRLHDVIYLRGTVPFALVQVANEGRAVTIVENGERVKKVEFEGVHYAPTATILRPATSHKIRFLLNRQVQYWKWTGSGDAQREQDTDFPSAAAEYMENVIENAEFGFRAIDGVSHMPLIDVQTGAVLAENGYSVEHAMLIDFDGKLGPIPDVPTAEAASAAVAVLLEPFKYYHMDGRTTKARLLAAALTAVARPSLYVCPGILINGNRSGAGKDYLAEALGTLTTRSGPVMITETSSREELDKRISSTLLASPQAFVVTNVLSELRSAPLEDALTNRKPTVRILGKTDHVTAANTALIMVTCNNPTVHFDMFRRTIEVRLVKQTTKFTHYDFKPKDHVKAHRDALLTAAFTILRWAAQQYQKLSAGERAAVPEAGGFEEWSRSVAYAVQLLMGESPVTWITDKIEDEEAPFHEVLIFRGMFGQMQMGDGDKTEMFGVKDVFSETDDGNGRYLHANLAGHAYAGLSEPDEKLDWVKLFGSVVEDPKSVTIGLWLARQGKGNRVVFDGEYYYTMHLQQYSGSRSNKYFITRQKDG